MMVVQIISSCINFFNFLILELHRLFVFLNIDKIMIELISCIFSDGFYKNNGVGDILTNFYVDQFFAEEACWL